MKKKDASELEVFFFVFFFFCKMITVHKSHHFDEHSLVVVAFSCAADVGSATKQAGPTGRVTRRPPVYLVRLCWRLLRWKKPNWNDGSQLSFPLQKSINNLFLGKKHQVVRSRRS